MTLAQIYAKYSDQIQFAMIYIREAHPTDGWSFGTGVMSKVIHAYTPQAQINIPDPRTIEERRRIADRCERTLQYKITTYVDDIDDRVNQLYAAHPTRLYLIGTNGKVVYAGGLGPLGFKPSEFALAIKRFLEVQE